MMIISLNCVQYVIGNVNSVMDQILIALNVKEIDFKSQGVHALTVILKLILQLIVQ